MRFEERKTIIELRQVTRCGVEIEQQILFQLDDGRTIDDMLEAFRCFLLAMGYQFKGELQVVDEEEQERDRKFQESVCEECEKTTRKLVKEEFLSEMRVQAAKINWEGPATVELQPRGTEDLEASFYPKVVDEYEVPYAEEGSK